MNYDKKIIFFVLIMSFTTIFGQTADVFVCGNSSDPITVPHPVIFSHATSPNILNNFQPVSYNISFWIVNKNDGSSEDPISMVKISQALQKLNEAFKPSNICFNLKQIDTINNTNYYRAPGYSGTNSIFGYAEQNGYVEPNSFNVYIPFRFEEGYSGISVGRTKIGLNSVNVYGAIVHEIGHCFSLHHTFSGFRGSSCEHVTRDTNDPDYNADIAGDEVADTNAVPEFYREDYYRRLDSLMSIGYDYHIADSIANENFIPHRYAENCFYIGDGEDCQGNPYTITENDVKNFMSYSPVPCKTVFSTGQIIRMQEYIEDDYYGDFANAECSCPFDLYTKDNVADLGLEPNTTTTILWESSDIWVRNQQDGIQENENPEYDPNNPSYVHVKVRNKSCQTSTGNEQLKLYWAKASASLNWPEHWNGNLYEQGVVLGDTIGTLNIPVLAPGEETVVEFPWDVPNPHDYIGINPNPWHFCLLSRIVASNDPMTTPEVSYIPTNVSNNNNIAWKNESVVDVEPNGTLGAVISVENRLNTSRAYNLEFVPQENEPGKPIYKDAEVSINMDDNLYQAWKNGGEVMDSIRKTKNPKEKIIIGNHATLKNIKYRPNEFGTLYLKFNFLTKKVTGKTHFIYNVIQRDASTNKIIGGETYVINRKNDRSLFTAQSNQTSGQNENMTLNAEPIGEPAVYNWYDPDGNLIYSGQELPLNSQVFQEYKLEVVANSDGYKDYDTIQLENPFSIESLTPNPASTNVEVHYSVGGAESAYLMFTSVNSGVSNNYILDENQTETSIDISNYTTGEYVVSLIRNGKVVDTKNLIKN